jgi:hypothetical protein
MRLAMVVGLLAGLSACVTPPAPPEVQAAHFGPVPPAPSLEQLASAERVRNWIWSARPRADDYVLLYPRNAWAAEVEARVVLNCIAQEDGSVACAAKDDGMPQYDFEQAARNLSTRFQLAPLTSDGVPIAGKRLVVSISFRLF